MGVCGQTAVLQLQGHLVGTSLQGGPVGKVPACMALGCLQSQGSLGLTVPRAIGASPSPSIWSTSAHETFGVSLHPGYSEHLGTQKCWGVSYPWSSDRFYSQHLGGVGSLEDFCTQIFWGVSAPVVLGAPWNPKFLGCLCILDHQSTLAPRIVGVSHTCGPWTTPAPKASGV